MELFFVWVTELTMFISVRCIIWKILYFWKFDNVKCTIVGMFVMKWLHTAVWGGHNYAFVADVIVRKMIIIIKNTGPSKSGRVKLIQLYMYQGSPLFIIFRALSRSLHRHSSVVQGHCLTLVYLVPAPHLLPPPTPLWPYGTHPFFPLPNQNTTINIW